MVSPFEKFIVISRIVTHSGPFHADDVLAVGVLLDLAPSAEVLRTRDRELLMRAVDDVDSAVVDVGWSWDATRNNFDHHQKDFDKVRANGVPYASIGLVWERYGVDWLRTVLEGESLDDLVRARELLDVDLIQSVDAFDCGAVGGALHVRETGTELRVPSVADLLGCHNPTWEEPPSFDAAFMDAVGVGQALLRRYAQRAISELRYGARVAHADDGSALLVLNEPGPWRRFVAPHHLVVVFPATGEDGWLVQAVGDPAATVFPPKLRIAYPEEWRGRGEPELQGLTGISDAVFCHRAGFIGGAQTREGAIALAHRLLESQSVG